MHEDYTEEDSIGNWWKVSVFHDEISLSFKQTPPETDKTQQAVLNILGIPSSRPTQEDIPYRKANFTNFNLLRSAVDDVEKLQ